MKYRSVKRQLINNYIYILPAVEGFKFRRKLLVLHNSQLLKRK